MGPNGGPSRQTPTSIVRYPPPFSRAMTRAPRVVLLALALLSSALAGCTSMCSPVEVPTEVALGLEDEEVRTLPVLVSGATRVAGQEVPDAHGRMELRVDVHHPGLTNESLNFTNVAVYALALRIEVEGQAVPTKLLRIEGESGWSDVGGDRWNGGLRSGERIVLWWTVDHEQDLLAIALPEGKQYEATIEFDWDHDTCNVYARGHTSTTFLDAVQATVNARTFAASGTPQLEVAPSGIGLLANFTVRSGLNVTVTGVEARAVRHGTTTMSVEAAGVTGVTTALPGAGGAGADAGAQANATVQVPLLGLALFPQLATHVNGRASQDVAPGQTLRVLSAPPTGSTYATSGQLLTPIPVSGEGLFVLTIAITYQPSDQTLGAQTDTFGYALRA